MSRLTLQFGDLTAVDAEALVNSTSEDLLSGGPVHQAVHAAAGPELLEACRKLGGCAPGEARMTPGFKLRARHVIHTVPPTWQGGDEGELNTLAGCYRHALSLAGEQGLRSIAFPSLGSGLQPQIPLERAAPVAIRAILGFLERSALPERVILVCYDAPTFQVHQKVLKEQLPS